MDFDEFIGQVMDKLQIGERSKGVRAVRATLTTLAERLQEGEATDLASSLPMEIDFYVLNAEHGQKFDSNEFIERVAEIEKIDKADAAYHTRIIMQTLNQAIPEGQMKDIRNSLPEEYQTIFELINKE